MKHVINHFKTHPDATEVHETSNGFLFHEKHSAVAHANELGKENNKVTTHSRGDFEKEIAASIAADNKSAKPAKEEKVKEEKPSKEKESSKEEKPAKDEK